MVRQIGHSFKLIIFIIPEFRDWKIVRDPGIRDPRIAITTLAVSYRCGEDTEMA